MGRRILYIEDEDSTHFGVREYFAELGHSVDCASNREEALERLATTSYPIVIADLRLSEHDVGNRAPEGLAIIERVRREHPDTRVLVLSACAEDVAADARRSGADFFLQKPQPLNHVAEIVERLCRGEPMREDVAAQTGASPSGRKRFEPGTEARKKVLLVDDSSTVLFMERALLSRSYDVITASNGREGVERALADKPDLILMDVIMPQMSGLEAVRRLRADPETKDIPVIIVSTRGELKSVESGYESGCNDYVTKPFSGVELLAKVKSCLGA